ncbi:MAG: hypothetical protein L0Z50_13755 [Verrucomicrobiales bacterium]|nr:hypothetical protein [Verrucomicrobiales bacterium]
MKKALAKALPAALLLVPVVWLDAQINAFQVQPIVTVNNILDAGPGSLREAILMVAPGGTIEFDPALQGQTVILTTGELIIEKDLTLRGPGASQLSITGNDANRVFNIANGRILISGLRITGGRAFDGGGLVVSGVAALNLSKCVLSGNTAAGRGDSGGGALSNNGDLTIVDCTFSNNAAAMGGAIINFGPSAMLNIQNSTFSDNTASVQAGAIQNQGGTVELVNSTISGNNGASLGGGILNIGLSVAPSLARLFNCTVANNTGGGIATVDSGGASATTQLKNTIVANNGGPAFATSGANAVLISLGHNLTSDASGAFSQPGDQQNIDPGLGPLQDNGGPALTHAPRPDSPALDAGDNARVPIIDQRGFPRVQDGNTDNQPVVDVGSFEAQPATLANLEIIPLSYAENSPAVPLTSTLTVTDIDNSTLRGAIVQFAENFAVEEDVLDFTKTDNITGDFNPANGRLTLTGIDSVANYQAALRSVTYQNPSGNPSTLIRRVSFQVNDGSAFSAMVSRPIQIIPAINPVTLSNIETDPLNYTENSPGLPVTSTLTLGGLEISALISANVQISDNYVNDEDLLEFVNTSSIRGDFNSADGRLNLTGPDTVANYQAALRSVTYRNKSDHPSTLVRTVGFEIIQANEVLATRALASRPIQIIAVNDPPVNSVPSVQFMRAGASLVFLSGNGNAISVADLDAGLSPVRVSLGVNLGLLRLGTTAELTFLTGDGTSDSTMSFLGSLPAINAALQGLTYQAPSGASSASGPDLLTITSDDEGNTGSGGPLSDTDSVQITLSFVNQAPSFIKGSDQRIDEDAPPQLLPNWASIIGAGSGNESGQVLTFIVSNNNNALFAAQPSISAAGTLTYTPAPNANGMAILTIVLKDDGGTANGGVDTSPPQTSVITVNSINDRPFLAGLDPNPLLYVENDGAKAIGDSIKVTDVDNPTLASAAAQIVENHSPDEDSLEWSDTATIKGTFESATGRLTLVGMDTLGNYETALRSVSYRNLSKFPSPRPRTVQFTVSDGAAESLAVTRAINVTPVDDPPTISDLSDVVTAEDTAAGPIAFTIADAESGVAGLLVSGSSSDTQLVPNDNIVFGGAGANRALFVVPAPNQNGTTTITLSVADPTTGATTTRSFLVTFRPVNDPPALLGMEPGALNYTEGEGGRALSSSVSVSDFDSKELTGATLRFTANYFKDEDSLEFVSTGSIQGNFDPDTGALRLSGTDTLENYQTALRAISYRNRSDNPNTLPRLVNVVVTDDGTLNSAALSREITVARVNTAPAISGLPSALRINQEATTGPIPLKLGDPDSPLTDLTLTASSSNSVLVPGANITLTGSGADRVLEIAPAVHRTGITTITITASDGNAITTARFDLMVNAIPILSELFGHVMRENTMASIPFAIADEETAPENLLLATGSSNTALIPNEAITSGGTGANRILTITPASNQFGTSTISVTVGDGNAATTHSFRLTVLARTPSPQDQLNIPLGGPASFRVVGRGLGPLRYQWRHNGKDIQGATGDTLTIPQTQLSNAGLYGILITDEFGTSVSGPARLTLQIPSGNGQLFDNFADAGARPALDPNGFFQFNNDTATREPSEPNHAGKAPGQSIWMTWVSPAIPGIVRFDTEGSAFDTVLAVYTGDAISLLSPVASNDDHDGLLSSLVRFSTSPQTVYRIAVDGRTGAAGDFVLQRMFEPTPEVVPIITLQPQGQNAALGSAVQLSVGFTPPGATVQWFRDGLSLPGATANTYGVASLNLPAIGTYSARIQNQVGPTIYEVFSEAVEIQVSTGADDVFAHDKFSELKEPSPALVQLLSRRRKPSSAPARGFTGTQVFSTAGAVTEPGEPVHCGTIGGASVWYAIQAEANGYLTILVKGTGFDPILAVYTDPLNAGQLESLHAESCNIAAPGSHATALSLPCLANNVYFTACDGVDGGAGVVELSYAVSTNAPIFSKNVVLSIEPLPTRDLKLLVQAIAGGSYILQSSTNLIMWSDLILTNSPSGTFEFISSNQPDPTQFRVKVNP